MSETEDMSKTFADMDDDVVVYVPKKKSGSRVEYMDDEGVRVVAEAPGAETTRRMPAVKPDYVQEPKRRMAALKNETEPHNEPQPVAVARRERGKTTNSRSRNRRGQHKVLNIPTGPLAAGLAALGILFLVIAIALSAGDKKNTLPGAATMGFVDDSGAACAPLYNGEAVRVEADAVACAVSPDRKNLLIQSGDGSISRYDLNKDKLSEICPSARPRTGIIAVRSSGVLYLDSEKMLHRFTFGDGRDVNIGKTESYAVAQNSMSILYTSGDKLYILPERGNEAVEAGGYSGTPKATAVSDDGQCAVWTDWSNNAQNIYLFDSRGRSTLETLVGTTSPTSAVFSENGSFLAVINPDSESAYLWNKGTVSRAKLGAVPVSERIYTASGPLEQNGDEEVKGVYVHVSGSAGGSVYYIDLLGEREKLISKVKDFQLCGGTACFTASDGNMYYSAVNGANTSERIRISADVQSFTLSKDGQYVYYLKDISAGLGTLYVYHIGDEEPKKIASDVYTAYVPCENSSVIYYKEPERIDAPDTWIGVMYLFSFGTGSNKIASDCVIGQVSSGSNVGRIAEDSFMYLKYLSSESAGKVYSNCVYFNGKESNAVLKDVFYDSASSWKLK